MVNDAYLASNEAIKLDMRSSKAYYLRARLRLCKSQVNEDFKLSIKDYKKALELEPDNRDVNDELSKCRAAFEDYKNKKSAAESSSPPKPHETTFLETKNTPPPKAAQPTELPRAPSPPPPLPP